MKVTRLGVLTACLLAGCTGTKNPAATTARDPVPPPSATGTADCFYARQVQNFRVLDRSNLIVYAPNDANAFHVLISPPSTQLRNAESLAFLPPTARICGHTGQRLIVGIGSATESLSVVDVSRLSPDSLTALRSGSTGPLVPAAEPQPGPGPDIEGATEKVDSPPKE